MEEINDDNFKLLDIQKSKWKNKKYCADIILNGVLYNNVNFGDSRYAQYEDKTPLKLYSDLNHYDEKKRRLYHIRHNKDKKPGALLSKYYLW